MADLLDGRTILVAGVLTDKIGDMGVRPQSLVAREMEVRDERAVLHFLFRIDVGHMEEKQVPLPDANLEPLLAEPPKIVITIY
jgi:hypothetical protein